VHQVASRALGIPIDKILVQESSTATVANAPGTGGSSASDLNGMAIVVSIFKMAIVVRK